MERDYRFRRKDIWVGGMSMKILHNKYNIIKQENIEESAKLKLKDRRMIDRMADYLSTKKISLYELEVIKKDIIGMAIEAELEGVLLREKIGVSEKEFVNNISLETKGNSWIERSMIIGYYILFIVSCLYTFEYIMNMFPKNWGVKMISLVFILGSLLYQEIIEKIFLKRFLYSNKRKQIKVVTTTIYVIVFSILYISLSLSPIGQLYIVKGNGLILGIILVLLTIMMYVGNSIYWNKQSKKFGAIY